MKDELREATEHASERLFRPHHAADEREPVGDEEILESYGRLFGEPEYAADGRPVTDETLEEAAARFFNDPMMGAAR